MRSFKTKAFARFARKERITDRALRAAVDEAQVSPDAVLGGELIKQRVARPGEGKSGGYRTILALRSGTRAVFLHGFAKSALSNIDARELKALKLIAAPFLNATDAQIETLIENGDLTEVGL